MIATDRLTEPKISKKGREIDAWYSGKAHAFGGVIQALMNPAGLPLWVPHVLPGSVHDLTAARELVLAILWPYTKTTPALADGGYDGRRARRTDPGTPAHGRHPPACRHPHPQQPAARAEMSRRAWLRPADRTLEALERVTMSPRKITQIARAALVLTQHEHKLIS
ncbi:transposase family protein [Actinospica sp.]|uniref:transposase family protein n=1 Tax=Actinospica sp. TaxID=1872142 RepID=UPI002B6DB760|nr:transposase family protein [Actinospica sp.]HWG25450.1 transposase family protein [Actinospica sp.]